MKILFISHDASRTGAPILLRNFLQWLKEKHPEIKFDILLRQEGDLRVDFEKLGKVFSFTPTKYFQFYTFLSRVLNKLGIIQLQYRKYLITLFKEISKQSYDVIYCNTIVNLDVLIFLSPLKIPVVTHVRELEITIQYFGGYNLVKQIDLLSCYFIADSNAVKDNLIKNHGIINDKITVVPEYIPIPESLPNATKRNEVRRALEIPLDAFVIGAAGTVLWRKGYDLFIQLAVILKSKLPNEQLYFVWVGHIEPATKDLVVFDLTKAGLTTTVKFIGSKSNPFDYFSIFDIFTLTSREEPFGIVGLESSLFETPVLCFDEAGGFPDFVEEDCGFIIPYLNVGVMADRIVYLIQNPTIKIKLGKQARLKTIEKHNISTVSTKLVDIIISHYDLNHYSS